MKKVSVVVPIYNVEKYLDKCLNSIAKQTYDNFDCYMVNDGSPDNSQNIIDKYTKEYPNKFIPIIKENGGYGSALEIAFNTTDSPFVLVCDGDDTLETNCLNDLINLQENNDVDLVIGAKNYIYEDSDKIDYSSSYNETIINELFNEVTYYKNNKNFNDLFFIDPSPHAKLYKTEIVKKIKFPHKVSYTDNLLFYYSLVNANTVLYTSKALANYLINRTGNSMSDISGKALINQVTVFNEIYDQCNKTNCPDMFYYRMFESFKFMLYQTHRLDCNKEEYTEVFKYLKTFLDRLIKHKNIIIPLYNEYAKVRFIEKYNDMNLLNEKRSIKTFNKLFNKLKNEHFK